VSAMRTSARLVRLYPPTWRARYGDELEGLIVEASGGQRVPWRLRIDVALGAARERMRAAGLARDRDPGERVRAGALLTLCAWALFVIAGGLVQRVSEHWQDAMAPGNRALPSAAFAVLVAGALAASLLVLAGIAAALPSLSAFLRGGGWPSIRRRVITAGRVTAAAAIGLLALVLWAHRLGARERNGADLAYALAFVAWALLAAAALLTWTGAAVTIARRIRLPAATLKTEAWLATGVAAAMGAMTAATLVWWVAVADAAPWFLTGAPAGTSASPWAPQLLLAAVLMLLATAAGAAGAHRGLRALPLLRSR
jgi:hypothetical protein